MEKITVLMAVYNPRQNWLEKQLKSINEQTYPNLELIICDDYSSEMSFERLEAIVKTCVTRISYDLQKNSHNMGSTKTFEYLTRQSTGAYCAYCDQDDIWEKEKLYREWEVLQQSNGLLVCTNANVVNENDQMVMERYMSLSQRLKKAVEHGTVWRELLAKNYFWGCTMLVKTKIAQKALPFADHMYHDHYLALCAASQGRIVFLDEPLVRYRIHGNNQTGFLKGIFCKRDYCEKRIRPLELRYNELLDREFDEEQKDIIREMLIWTLYREKYACGQWGQRMGMIKYAKFNRVTTLFELLTMPMPDFWWIRFVELLKKIRA